LEIIKNKELIAFSQDKTVGKPAMPFTPFATPPTGTTAPPQFYSGNSSRGTHVFVVNTNDTSATFHINFTDVPGLGLGSSPVYVHDMWTSKDLGAFAGGYNVTLAAHDTAALLLTHTRGAESASFGVTASIR
jgi:alpha-galactosidase